MKTFFKKFFFITVITVLCIPFLVALLGVGLCVIISYLLNILYEWAYELQ